MGLLKWLKSSVPESRVPTGGRRVVPDPAPAAADAGLEAPRDQATGRAAQIGVLVSGDELTRIKSAAAADHQHVSQWCRDAILARLEERGEGPRP